MSPGVPMYALFQHSLEPLDLAAVGAVLDEAMERLVRADAPLLVRRAFGVLADRLSRSEADEFQQALGRRGVAVEIAEQEWLALPMATPCVRAEFGREGLVAYDHSGRAAAAPWSRILVIAVGSYPRMQRVFVRSGLPDAPEWPATRNDGSELYRMLAGRGKHEHREQDQTVIELLTGEAARYRIRLDQFDYSCLGQRRKQTTWQNFPLLVQELIGHAPRAARTQGIANMSQAGRPIQRYPGAHHLEREIAWTLWRYCGPGTGLDASAPYRTAMPIAPRLAAPLLATKRAKP